MKLLLAIAVIIFIPPYGEATETSLPNLWPQIEKGKLIEITPEKKPVDLSSFDNKVLVIQFWASWCSNCKKEMVELAKFKKNLPQESYSILAISEDEEFKDALKATKRIDPSFSLAYDNERVLFKSLPKHKLPFTLVFLPQNRKLVCLFNGYNPRRFERLKTCIRNLVSPTK